MSGNGQLFDELDIGRCCLKGHAAPVLYAAWAEVGIYSAQELLNLRKLDSDLEGHPTPVSHSPIRNLSFILND